MPHTDIQPSAWIIKTLPKGVQAYALLLRLDRPIGWWLLVLPAWWAIALAGGGVVNMQIWEWFLLLLFLAGAIIMRGAGCIINDLWDRDLDKQVERTAQRPLPSGTLQPFDAMVFLVILLMIGLGILLILPLTAIIIGFLSIPLIILYPLMKRITWWPQAFLGLTFNLSALIGWASATGSLSLPAFLLYVSCIFWTLGYDTIYAHQDMDDDKEVGIKSTAIKLSKSIKDWIITFYIISFICLIMAVFLTAGIINATLLVIPALHLAWQVKRWDIGSEDSALAIFKSNKIYGLLVFAICMV